MASDNRLLIVENDPAVAGAIETAGSRLHLTVDCATDGWDAIEKLEENDYQLIMVDLEMPQSSGFGVLTYLRQEYGHDLDRLVLISKDGAGRVQDRIHEPSCRIVDKTTSVDQLTSLLSECSSVSAKPIAAKKR